MSALGRFQRGFLDELEKWATDLTEFSRDKIKDKNFALPGRRYPIHDLNHARAALSMVSAHGSPEEKAQVHAAVANKYPALASRSASIDKESAAKPAKETRKGWLVTGSRKGRRPMRVSTLLKKEKDGSIGGYKFAYLLPKAAEASVPFIAKDDPAAAKPPRSPSDIPSREAVGGGIPKREDGRGNVATLHGPSLQLADISAQPGERSE